MHDVLRSSAPPLDSATRAYFEPRFGHDLGNVRVHTDARAAESAQAVNALAYTVGSHVVFGEEHGPADRHLMAHELAHVAQQSGPDAPEPRLARKQTEWPDWHAEILALIVEFAGPSDGETADHRWIQLVRTLCSFQPAQAESLHARLNTEAPGLKAGTDDFAVYMQKKFPVRHERMLLILERLAQGKTPTSCGLTRSRKLRTRTLVLNITRLEGSTRALGVVDASRILRAAAGIRVVGANSQTLDRDETEYLIGSDLTVDEHVLGTLGEPTEEERRLTRVNRREDGITAYFVKAQSRGSAAGAYSPSSYPTLNPSVILQDDMQGWEAGNLLAHELLHVLMDDPHHAPSLEHIMGGNYTAEGLYPAEVLKARSSPLLLP